MCVHACLFMLMKFRIVLRLIKGTGCLQCMLQGVSPPILGSCHVYSISTAVSKYPISTVNYKVYRMTIKIKFFIKDFFSK